MNNLGKCGYCGEEIIDKNNYGYYSILSGLIDSKTGSPFRFHNSCQLKRDLISLQNKIKEDLKNIKEIKKELKKYE